MKAKKGFTLIELLVVIAIIAILAAILFPVFAQAREKARQTVCASNEKQMGLAMLMYTQDYDETFPMLQYYDVYGNPIDWYGAVGPYIKNGTTSTGYGGVTGISYGEGGIWSCPSFPDVEPAEYGVNWELCQDGKGTYEQSVLGAAFVYETATLATVDDPSNRLMIAEKGRAGNVPSNAYSYSTSYIQPSEGTWTNALVFVNGQPTQSDSQNGARLYDKDCAAAPTTDPTCGAGYADSPGDMPRYRHSGTSNIVYIDGHVKSTPKGQLQWFKSVYIKGLYEREAQANNKITGWTYPLQ